MLATIEINDIAEIKGKRLLTDTIYILKYKEGEDGNTGLSEDIFKYFNDRLIATAHIYKRRKGITTKDLRFVVLAGDLAHRLQGEPTRQVALLTPGTYLLVHCDQEEVFRRAMRQVSTVLGYKFDKVEELLMSDPRLDAAGLTQEDRDEIFSDGYFLAITRMA